MKTLALILLTLALSACGAEKVGPSELGDSLASRSSSGSLGGDEVARCNLATVPAASMEGVLSVFASSAGYQLNRIRLKMTRAPSALTSTSTVSLRVYRWGYVNGAQVSNGVPAPIRFYLNDQKAILNDKSPVIEVSQSVINQMVSTYGLAAYGVTTSNFFTKVSLLIDDVDMSYDALTFSFFDSTRGSAAYASGNSLIPAFHADPAEYARFNPESALQAIHPLNTSRGWAKDVYAKYFEQLCKL